MENYNVMYVDRGQPKTFNCEADSPEDAENQLTDYMKGKRIKREYEITEIIPAGIIAGRRVTIFEHNTFEL